MMGTEVKYWNDIQIVHEVSKRFLSIEPVDQYSINKYFDSNVFLDTDILNIAYSSYTS